MTAQILVPAMVSTNTPATSPVMYDTETVPVASAPGAECVTVTDGKITYSRFVFDQLPFDAARKATN